ncbi:MAG: hypothetical protein Q8877_03540, partial [Sweet potato little leaf phytoplasma]|nr:hypothetical protein [Sweet potato little leaf phytoplasma]
MAGRRNGNDRLEGIIENLIQMNQTLIQMNQSQAQHIATAAAAAVAAIHPPPAPVEVDWLTRFRKSDPKQFEGGYNPDGAQRWLQEIEKIFRSLQPPPEHKVRLAEYMLAGEAEHWWDQQRRGYDIVDQEITWELFRT